MNVIQRVTRCDLTNFKTNIMGDIEITEDSFLEMSKFTIIPSGLKCEQSGNSRECGVVLSCWHAFSHVRFLFIFCMAALHDSS